MTETQFLITLAQTRKAYNWSTEGKTIVGVAKNGKARGKKYAPITAVCRYAGKGTNPSTKRGTTKAGKQLGMTPTLTKNVSNATQAVSNRGNSQVLRGKIKQVLGL